MPEQKLESIRKFNRFEMMILGETIFSEEEFQEGATNIIQNQKTIRFYTEATNPNYLSPDVGVIYGVH